MQTHGQGSHDRRVSCEAKTERPIGVFEAMNHYQEEARRFANYAQAEYPFLGLGEEAGEVMGKLAKFSRKTSYGVGAAIVLARETQNGFSRVDQQKVPVEVVEQAAKLREDLIKELGDVAWMLAACCSELEVDLETVLLRNIEKLDSRLKRGVIIGEGDDR